MKGFTYISLHKPSYCVLRCKHGYPYHGSREKWELSSLFNFWDTCVLGKSSNRSKLRCFWITEPEVNPGFFTPKLLMFLLRLGLPWWLRGQSVCLHRGRPGFDPWVGKIPWRRKWQPTPVCLPGESHGRRSLVGYSPRGRKHRLHFTLFIHCVLFTRNLINIQWMKEWQRDPERFRSLKLI